jgi:hypothetical protein
MSSYSHQRIMTRGYRDLAWICVLGICSEWGCVDFDEQRYSMKNRHSQVNFQGPYVPLAPSSYLIYLWSYLLCNLPIEARPKCPSFYTTRLERLTIHFQGQPLLVSYRTIVVTFFFEFHNYFQHSLEWWLWSRHIDSRSFNQGGECFLRCSNDIPQKKLPSRLEMVAENYLNARDRKCNGNVGTVSHSQR